MDQWAFFAQPQARGNGQTQAEGFDDESPGSEKVSDNEAAEKGFDLGYAALFGVERVFIDQ